MSDPQAHGPRLELHGPGLLEQVYEFKGAHLHIGRARGLEICLDDARVSRHHARIEHRSDGNSFIVDLDSKRSTKLNGRKLAPFQPVPLYDGCRIKIVDYELIFRNHRMTLPEKADDRATVLETLDDLSSSHLARRTSYPVEALEAILEVNRALGGRADLDEILGRALDGLMTIFPAAERGFVVVIEPEGRPRVRAVRQRCGSGRAPVPSRTKWEHVVQQCRAVLIRDTTIDSRFNRAKSLIAAVRTALSVPLVGHDGEPLGMIQLDRSDDKGGFKPGDLDLLAALAVPIGVAVENHQLLQASASWAAAREIQLALLPRGRPEITGYSFWECFRPSLDVGGDLYDYNSPTVCLREAIMGLRKVPDQQTQALMIDFYRRLMVGEGRAEARRQAQFAMKEKYSDRLWWGAFTYQGDPSPLVKFESREDRAEASPANRFP
jgi:phosphoserine phosphatase RsbU/P